jgi:hypothetical protein
LSDHSEVNKGLKQGDGLTHLLLEYAIRQLPVDQIHYSTTYLVKLLVMQIILTLWEDPCKQLQDVERARGTHQDSRTYN